jgi:hypothetical protein
MFKAYTSSMNTKSTPQSVLHEIAQIQHMERGTVNVIRQGPQGPYYNHQCYEQGRNVSRYVPTEQRFRQPSRVTIVSKSWRNSTCNWWLKRPAPKEPPATQKKTRPVRPVNPGPKCGNPATPPPLCDRATQRFNGTTSGAAGAHGGFPIG